jgi:hypothetical protein
LKKKTVFGMSSQKTTTTLKELSVRKNLLNVFIIDFRCTMERYLVSKHIFESHFWSKLEEENPTGNQDQGLMKTLHRNWFFGNSYNSLYLPWKQGKVDKDSNKDNLTEPVCTNAMNRKRHFCNFATLQNYLTARGGEKEKENV